ncbi:MAG: PTS sugar transporter subunit IIA [Epulopiscium sp.]|nr:PTS sugar transporter subunit IIA [Candidatus Epulonipiscium sp.]
MLITEELIDFNLQATTKEEAIEQLGNLAHQVGRVKDVDAYVEAVLKREEAYSTSVGFGVAIPHGKTDAVLEPFLGFAKVKDIDWNAPDGSPVDLVFIIGVPEAQKGTEHLTILAKISRNLMKEEFREQLRKIHTKEGILSLIQEVVQ